MTQTNSSLVSNNSSVVILGTAAVNSFTAVSGVIPTITGTSDSDLLRGTNGDDLIIGLEGRDTLIGGAGNDVLIGGLDSDRLIGGLGSDRFVFNNFDERTDTISDFNVDEDALVLTNLFSYFSNDFDPIASGYLTFVQEGANMKVQVDPDGVGGFPATTIAILNNVDAQTLTAVVLNDVIDTNTLDLVGAIEPGDTLTGSGINDMLVGGMANDLLTTSAKSHHLAEKTTEITSLDFNEDPLVMTNIFAQLNDNGGNLIADGYLPFLQQGLDAGIQFNSHDLSSSGIIAGV
jgi:Ca2+-binding RTX toxin-like protein